jgi:hypothetical protein
MMKLGFDEFLQQAWADHAERAEAVADRLRTETPAPTKSEHIGALVRLVVHLLGEHLGRFDDARWRLAALADHPLLDEAAQSALRVGQAALDLAQRDATAVRLSATERTRAEATAAAVSVVRGQSARALHLLASARERVARLPEATAADHRPLAVACNNMAWELHARGAARSDEDSAAMLDIAAASRAHWSMAGTWLEVERADYCLALTHLAAGRADAALPFAAQCLAACIAHDAPPYEHFYGHEALARVQHARGDGAATAHHVQAARAAFERLDVDGQSGCRKTLDELRALTP